MTVEPQETTALKYARKNFNRSVANIERKVDTAERSLKKLKSKVSGKHLWQNHFAPMAATAVGMGLLVALQGRSGRASLSQLTNKIDADRLAKQIANSVEARVQNRLSRKSGKSVTDILTNPTLLTSVIGFGLNLLSNKDASGRHSADSADANVSSFH